MGFIGNERVSLYFRENILLFFLFRGNLVSMVLFKLVCFYYLYKIKIEFIIFVFLFF